MTADTIVDQNECTICQEDLEIGQEIVFMPDCHHSFHNECVQRWFRLVRFFSPIALLTLFFSKVGVLFAGQKLSLNPNQLMQHQPPNLEKVLMAGKQI